MAVSKKQLISIIVAAVLTVLGGILGYIFGVSVQIEQPEVVVEEVIEVEATEAVVPAVEEAVAE